jgi:hypothetical protein
MSFINKYNKANHSYFDTKQIGNAIYAVGNIFTAPQVFKALITKTDLNGNVVWEKIYNLSNGGNQSFENIIGCDNGDLLLILSSNQEKSLARIDGSGNVVWSKLFPPFLIRQFVVSISLSAHVIRIAPENYIFQISRVFSLKSPQEVNTRFETENLIFKIDATGNILAQKQINTVQNNGFDFKGISTNTNKIIAYGYLRYANTGVIFEFDFNLNLLRKINCNFVGVFGAFYSGNDIIILGNGTSPINGISTSDFLARITPQNLQNGIINIKYFTDTQTIYQLMYFNDQFIYLKKHSSYKAVVTKLNHNLDVIWTKTFNGFVYYNNFISGVTNNGMIVCYDSVIGSLNLDLDSCLSVTNTSATTLASTATISLDSSWTVSPTTIVSTNRAFTVSNVTSVKEEICPTLVIVTPTFNQINPICSGKPISQLPTTSLNNITGAWSPAINNTTTTTYTFTPNVGQNALPATMTIVVNPVITPTFAQVAPINVGNTLPPLPTISLEGIIGVWSPALNNLTTTTYTFTPNSNFCAVSTTMTIIVNAIENPCIKNDDICNLYSTILSIYNDYLATHDPSSNIYNSVNNYSQQVSGLISSFHANNPEYELQIKLEAQIITLSVGASNFNTYSNILNSVQYILDYLSPLGNCNCENSLTISENSLIQSGSLYLQAAGSLGYDSAKGIHLRWTLKGVLGNHLPKANYATPNINFNKNDDFIRIYRTKYVENKVLLDFSIAPNQVNETQNAKNWVYIVGQKVFYIHFKNTAKYNDVKNQLGINPTTNSLAFIENYGNSLIEIENKTELSFAITPKFTATANTSTGPSKIKLELLSVNENNITASKVATHRKEYTQQQVDQTKLISENIRSIRFTSSNAYINGLEFEFYSDLIKTNSSNSWNFLGKFALTLKDSVAFQRLEPAPQVLSNWLRYKEGDILNVENYKTKWNGDSVTPEERIEEVVKKYIELSESPANPLAIEAISTNNDDEVNECLAEGNPEYEPNTSPTQESIEISNLVLLQIGALDYHVARMLGLGHLDLDTVVFNDQYIYLSEYVTFADLGDGFGAREMQHLYCSLPTKLEDERLPIPVELSKIEEGIFYQPTLDSEDPDQPNNNALLTDADGLSLDGKTQFYTLFSNDIPEEVSDATFYYKNDTLISSDITMPIYAGLKFRKDTEAPDWRKPGISFELSYKNADLIVNETKPIIIPDAGNPIYIQRLRSSGTYEYTSYGINWFSRASDYGTIISKTTNIKSKNTLLPPTNIVAALIQKENPLLFTTATEQQMYSTNPNSEDKTLVRLTFEYNHAQELVDYHQKVNGELIKDYAEPAHENFADDIQITFRNQVPNTISGKIKSVQDGNSPLLSVIETDIFPIYSSGIDTSINPQTNPPTYNENIVPIVPAGLTQNFIGSILLANEVSYIIHEIDTSATYPKFTVFKSDISGALVNLTTTADPANLIEPAADSLFFIVENMQKLLSWQSIHSSNPFKVKIDLTAQYKEEVIVKSTDCSTNTYVQKFRGVYQTAQITKIKEKIYNDDDPTSSSFVEKHLGLYKIIFPGFSLPQHSQYKTNGEHSVEWNDGIVRLHTWNGLAFDSGYRKNFKVVRTENIGTTQNLILYVEDLTFPNDPNDPNDPDYATVLSKYNGKLMDDGVESNTQLVNYYPGYKVYLYKAPTLGLTKENVLPIGDEDVRYTIFGLQSHDNPNEFEFDNTTEFFSAFSAPKFMFAQAVREPLQPQKPKGGMYATRPDYFGKSSYSFETVYGPTGTNSTPVHKPHSVQFNRASDVQFLSTIYDNSILGYDPTTKLPIKNTVELVTENIFMNGNEDFYVNRWDNLLQFNYNYDNDIPNNPLLQDENGKFKYFEGKRLPMPNNKQFIESINNFINSHNDYFDNLPTQISRLNITKINNVDVVSFVNSTTEVTLETIIIPEVLNSNGSVRNAKLLYKDFLKDVILNCFVPLTEVPVIYDFIKENYKPIPKKQVVRDRNGQLLKPTDADFDMAPMALRYLNTENKHTTKFTDFGLDGASNAKYFYATREINNQMKTSPYSTILGPISLVNTAPPTAPEIVKIIPVLENRVLGIRPAIQLEINSYSTAQNIKKINIYRADNATDALTVRTMKLVRVVDLEVENLTNDAKWVFTDDFNLAQVPYGDILYYRLTVSRIIKYNDADNQIIVDYAPSEASKLVITNVVENYSPESPVLKYASKPINSSGRLRNVTFFWEQNVYKGNYYLYKMTPQGNWTEIARIQSDRETEGKYHIFNTNGDPNWHLETTTNAIENNIYLPLEITNVNASYLDTKTIDDSVVYHHFKVIAENTAGMFSRAENILSIYNLISWRDIGGIAITGTLQGMIIGPTFIVSQDGIERLSIEEPIGGGAILEID